MSMTSHSPADLDKGCATEPMVSIHCITFNHEQFIAKALDSFLEQQTSFPVEIVVGDDCSTDDTRKIIETYVSRYPDRIRLIASVVNVGPAANFERTLTACRGKYVAICEGDDYWRDPTKLEQQVRFLERFENYVMCFHDAVAFDESGFESRPQLPFWLRRDATARELIRARPISTLSVCFRNVVKTLPPEIRHSPILDLCMWSLLGHYGSGKYLPAIRPAAYRKHAGGLMSLKSQAHRLRATAQAFLCLARYYERVAMPQHVSYFTRVASVACGKALRTDGALVTLAALAGSLLFRPIYGLYVRWLRR
jgi:glycosyltransferase involved in cell wall biosynthesis